MAADEQTPAREILLLGPYGVLGTGVVDAVAANPAWRVVTAARRPAPAYRDPDGVRHINVDLWDREGAREILTKLDTVTDLVFAAYVEKPTMAETVEPNARMFRNALDALSARWPKTATQFSNELRRVAPQLALHGLLIRFSRNYEKRLVAITRVEVPIIPASGLSYISIKT